MSKAPIELAGTALFGEMWKGDLARALGVADRTMRRWANDQDPIPPGVWRDLRTLLGGQLVAVHSAIAALPIDDESSSGVCDEK